MLTLVLFTSAIAVLLAVFYRKRSKLPPGPFPLPFVGNIHQLGWLAKKNGGIVGALKHLRKTYGPVFTLWLGPLPTVHICTMELAQETMVKRGGEFVDRWAPSLWNVVAQDRGIFISNGPNWLEQRRFALHTLRNFGLGRSIMEDRIMMELNCRTKTLDEELEVNNNEMTANLFFELTVGSIINRMLFSERFEKHAEEEFFTLKHNMDEITADFGAIDQLYEYPMFRNLPILKNRWTKMLDVQYDLKNFIHKQVQARIDAIESGDHIIADEPEDYVDAFVAKMKKETDPDTSYTIDGLVFNITDLWTAGQETTTITLLSGFYQLLHHPEVVKKLREELLSVTKGERHLSLKDKPNTPYLNAVAIEIQRIASIVSINLFRQTAEDTTVGGHPVAKGIPITAEVSVLMSDEKYFKDPEKFDPSRYFDSDDLDQHVLPFGLGKRSCPGESLARAEIYLITGNLILRYDIAPPDSEPLAHNENVDGFFKAPPKYKMKLTKIDH